MNKEKMIVLGTGTAGAIDSYNTCFLLQNKKEELFLVDTGGGNGILKQLKRANIDINNIHNIFISHKHIDHLLGIIWLFRGINISMNKGKYNGTLNIYCHEEVAKITKNMVTSLLRPSQQNFLDTRIFINTVKDSKIVKILDYNIEFFDINAKSDKQFGFKTTLNNGKTLVFSGDEPLDSTLYYRAKNADYLLHEAFCLEDEATKFKPHEKNHDTVESASKKAHSLDIKNLVLWHSQENLGKERKNKYIEASKKHFLGNVYVPDDLDIIILE